MVATGTQFGVSVRTRAVAGLAALAVAATLRPSTRLWRASAGLGAVALASFAWSGHGADGEGAAGLFKLAADVLHLLAAGVWLGALAALLLLVLSVRRAQAAALQALYGALEGFSGVGSLVARCRWISSSSVPRSTSASSARLVIPRSSTSPAIQS